MSDPDERLLLDDSLYLGKRNRSIRSVQRDDLAILDCQFCQRNLKLSPRNLEDLSFHIGGGGAYRRPIDDQGMTTAAWLAVLCRAGVALLDRYLLDGHSKLVRDDHGCGSLSTSPLARGRPAIFRR